MNSIIISHEDKKRGLIIPFEINEDLAEEIGIHIGDGSMNVYNKSGVYSLEGHIKDDKNYFLNHIDLYLREFTIWM